MKVVWDVGEKEAYCVPDLTHLQFYEVLLAGPGLGLPEAKAIVEEIDSDPGLADAYLVLAS